MHEVHETEVDGVRCYWIDSGRPTLAASLMFRAGMVDETFATRGWLHLLEHMSLHGRGGGALQINGSVSLLTTTFDAHGPHDLVASHLADVTRWLAHPDLGDLSREIGVLRAEERTRGANPTADALLWRYGSQGPGLCAVNEFGLSRATADTLQTTASSRFHRGNAVLALDGPPPPGLVLPLPEAPSGSFAPLPPPPARPCEPHGPGSFVSPGLVISSVVTRSAAASLLPNLIEAKLRTRLRDQEGASYAPWSVYEHVDSESAAVLAGADVAEKATSGVLHTGLEVVTDIAARGADPDDLGDLVARITQSMRDPFSSFGFALRAANRALLGKQPETPEEAIAELEAIVAQDLCEPAAQARAYLHIGASEAATTPEVLPRMTRPAAAVREGVKFRSVNWPADTSIVTVSDQQVSVHQGRNVDDAASVQIEDLVGLVRFQNGVRILVASDSWNLTVEPSRWRDGTRLSRLIDDRVPAHLQVQPASEEWHADDAALSPMRRWWLGLRRVLQTERAGQVYLVLFGLFVLAALAAGLYIIAIVWAAILIRTIRSVRSAREKAASGNGPPG